MKKNLIVSAMIGAILLSSISLVSAKGIDVVSRTGACDTAKSFTYRGDATTGDINFATSITTSYSIKLCDKRADTRVEVTIYNSATGEVAFLDTDMPLSNSFTITGVLKDTSYTAKATVYNRATDAVLGVSKIFVAAKTNPGV